MFRRLRIQNFKAWRDSGDIRLAPLTVLFGSNSAGKSSLIQFLLMLKQTAESPDRRRVLHPGDQHTPVDLGTFHDLVFEHDVTKPITFEFDWAVAEGLLVYDPRKKKIFTGDDLSFEAAVSAAAETSLVKVLGLHYKLRSNGTMQMAVAMRETKDGYELTSQGLKLVRNQGRAWLPRSVVRFYGFPDEVFGYYQNASGLSDLALALEQQLHRIQYLGPLRMKPNRMYTWAGEVPEHVGFSGERAIEALLAARDRVLNTKSHPKKQPFHAVIAQWLKKMGVLDDFIVRPIGRNRKEYEVLVRAAGQKEQVSLTDVGFGVSQVLPVLVECFYAPPSSTILMEQPELHLHPSVQSSLADLFLEATAARENNQSRNIQLVIESHSEHFLRRLQRRIAEGVVQPECVALYFCERGNEGSIIRELDVDSYGNIKNWPQDFFGDEFGDRAAQMDAILTRQKESEAAL